MKKYLFALIVSIVILVFTIAIGQVDSTKELPFFGKWRGLDGNTVFFGADGYARLTEIYEDSVHYSWRITDDHALAITSDFVKEDLFVWHVEGDRLILQDSSRDTEEFYRAKGDVFTLKEFVGTWCQFQLDDYSDEIVTFKYSKDGTLVQSEMDINHREKSWGRSTAEGVWELLPDRRAIFRTDYSQESDEYREVSLFRILFLDVDTLIMVEQYEDILRLHREHGMGCSPPEQYVDNTSMD